jgi:squalene-associated FAD-dependent desaturase
MPRVSSVAVIGAGWAGCAAAVRLTSLGYQVTLLEATRTAGGRARRVEQQGLALDNGQHILLGAYRDSLSLMRTVGIRPDDALLRLPLQMRYPPDSGGMDLLAPHLPAPLHMAWALWRADGLSAQDKLALARFFSAARWMDWRLEVDCSVLQLLERFDQTERVVSLLWRPLCLAALNTPPERASASVFLHVLRDSLGARRAASDMLLPRVDLSALLPDAAMRYLEAHGSQSQTGVLVRSISKKNQQWQIHADAYCADFDALIVATPPWVAATLLHDHDPALSSLPFTYESITTCYLRYPATVTLPSPFYALQDAAQHHQWGQFVFDRGQLHAAQAGLLAVVISASAEAHALGADALLDAVAIQLATVFQREELKQPLWRQCITEKRATFACTPGLKRPVNATACERLWIAGDYTAGDYPATLESAVQSGLAAAHLLTRANATQ